MTYHYCSKCRGQKQVKTMGGMSKQCDLCKGVGFAKKEIEAKPDAPVLLDDVEASNSDQIVKIDKRRKEHRIGA